MQKNDLPKREAVFYRKVISSLCDSQVPFMIGGAYALREYADVSRHTKDLDIFCLPGDHERLLRSLADEAIQTLVVDANWLAKARKNQQYVDIIFNSANNQCRVDQAWFDHARKIEFLGCPTHMIPPEELIWTKLYVQDRDRFDGADVMHMILRQGPKLDWKRLMQRMDLHWEILLAQLLTFRFVYPSERDCIPQWVQERLLDRVMNQTSLPAPQDRICRGPLLSRTQYQIDITEWGYEWGFKQS